MYQTNRLSSFWHLALVSCSLALLLQAVGCGRVRDDVAEEDPGSETHWLVRCDADVECGEGSCECGVCTRSCVTASDCARLGVPGTECVATANQCAATAASSGGSSSIPRTVPDAVCVVPCTRDAECSELGPRAVCRAQRCELPGASIETGGMGGATMGTSGVTNGAGGVANAMDDEIPELCDGSDDIRVAYATGGGFVDSTYAFFASTYGRGFFAIDGQCRFWQGRAADGWVYTGTLEPGDAQSFATALGYGHLGQYSAFEDPPCPDGPASALWTPEGQIGCSCACTTNPDAAEGWRSAFRAVSTASTELFEAGEPSLGPARLALIPLDTASAEPRPWPLERAPAATEIEAGFPLETSGTLIEDAAELVSLRALRAVFKQQDEFSLRRPVSWVDSNADQPQLFDFMLRDEVPEPVRAVLRNAQRLP